MHSSEIKKILNVEQFLWIRISQLQWFATSPKCHKNIGESCPVGYIHRKAPLKMGKDQLTSLRLETGSVHPWC